MKPYIRVCAEINLDAAAYNFRSMKENLKEDTKIIAVVKTDGYGHGAIPIARMAESYDYVWGFAVALAEEAVLLRKAGVKKPILILGFVFPDACEEIVRYDIRPAVFTMLSAEQVVEIGPGAGAYGREGIADGTAAGNVSVPASSPGDPFSWKL